MNSIAPPKRGPCFLSCVRRFFSPSIVYVSFIALTIRDLPDPTFAFKFALPLISIFIRLQVLCLVVYLSICLSYTYIQCKQCYSPSDPLPRSFSTQILLPCSLRDHAFIHYLVTRM